MEGGTIAMFHVWQHDAQCSLVVYIYTKSTNTPHGVSGIRYQRKEEGRVISIAVDA